MKFGDRTGRLRVRVDEILEDPQRVLFIVLIHSPVVEWCEK